MSEQSLTLWLTIKDPRFAHLIQTLAGLTDTIPFQPHVTLIGGIKHKTLEELDQIVQQLVVTGPRAFNLRMHKIEVGKTFFKTLYLVPEDSELLTMIWKAANDLVYPSKDLQTYKPHMSLLYKTNFDPKHEGKVTEALRSFFGLSESALARGELEEKLKEAEVLNINSVDIVSCPEDAIQDWHIIKSTPLAAPLRRR